MPTNDLGNRVDRNDERLNEILVIVTRNSGKIQRLEDDLDSIVAELGGAPMTGSRGDRRTLRWRLHQLENDQAAAKAAKAALEAATEAKRTAWSNTQKGFLFLFAALAAVLGLLNYLGVG